MDWPLKAGWDGTVRGFRARIADPKSQIDNPAIRD
jgi:hypothetical protein